MVRLGGRSSVVWICYPSDVSVQTIYRLAPRLALNSMGRQTACLLLRLSLAPLLLHNLIYITHGKDSRWIVTL